MNKFLKKKQKFSAFSLVELSIVLVVIGIAIAGITQSSTLIGKYRLSAAQSMTQSSPVNSISNLVLWLEPTLESSFLSQEAEDGSEISTWFDQNQVSIKNNATAVATARPIYKKNCINNLPCLYFDEGDYMTNTSMYDTAISFTMFVVLDFDRYAPNAQQYIYRSRVDDVIADGQIFILEISTNMQAGFNYSGQAIIVQSAASFSGNVKRPYLMTFGEKTGSNYFLRINNVEQYSSSSNILANGSKLMKGYTISDSNPSYGLYKANVAEIIFFNKYLKQEERNEVENYLIKKWKIITN